MKASDLMMMSLGVGVIGAALVLLYQRGAFAGTLAPPRADQYHAANNPNGYVFIRNASGQGGGQWTKTTPNGAAVYWSDVL